MEEKPRARPCWFRQVDRGRTFCTRATDEYDREVSPIVCDVCPVPGWLEAGICEHLDIGTELARKMGGEAGPRVFTACRFFRERLEGLERCRTCEQFSPWKPEQEQAEEGTRGQGLPRMMPGCFRTGVESCLRSPQMVPNWVLVLPPPSLRPAEAYRGLVETILKQGGLQGVFFLGPLRDIDGVCDLCAAIQQSPRLVVDLSEWDPGALFAMGLGQALGRGLLLVRGQDATPPFVPQGFPVYTYGSGDELAMILVNGLGIRLRPPEEDKGKQAAKAPQQEKEKA
ncbi:MAG: hypothetical protein ACP5SI_05070 [Chloroflexia bacterium]